MNTTLKMILTLLIIGLISGAALSSMSSWANPYLLENARIKTQEGIFKVQPTGKSYEKIALEGMDFYKVFDDAKTIIGYAIVYQGNGFADKIQLMIGIEADLQKIKIVGMQVLSMKETPGLGTKISDAPYNPQFNNLSAEPKLELVKTPKSKENEVQAITGATISSRAVVNIINEALDKVRAAGGKL